MENEKKYAVITENDVSQWNDITGERYHFPSKYKKFLQPGTVVIYYKGWMKDKKFKNQRLDVKAYYFAEAIIGEISRDEDSDKGDFFATIEKYRPFEERLLAKQPEGYFEEIPSAKTSNFWRDGVRPITEAIYKRILMNARIFQPAILSDSKPNDLDSEADEESLVSYQEGKKTSKFVTVYERNLVLKKQAKEFHGTTCFACGFNFGEFYGGYAKDFIHIHHVVPVSEFGESKDVNPKTDLVPVCANCHGVIHRRKDRTLSINELKAMIAASKKTP